MKLKKKEVRANDLKRKNKNNKKGLIFKKIIGVLVFELVILWLAIHIVTGANRDDKHKIAKPKECWKVMYMIIQKSPKDMANGQNII